MQKRLPTRTPSTSIGAANGDSPAGTNTSSNASRIADRSRCARSAAAVFSEATRGYSDIVGLHGGHRATRRHSRLFPGAPVGKAMHRPRLWFDRTAVAGRRRQHVAAAADDHRILEVLVQVI